tara:strand:+ start:776 stop:1477 length:702 start_codon:yes stop_codon:yes gene_type:complete
MQFYSELINQGKLLFKYRGQTPIMLLFIAIPMIIQTSFYNQYSIIIQNTGIIISILGLLMRYYTIGSTPNETSGRNRDKQIAEKLNTTGIYSLIRHPLYMANYIIWLGLSIFSLSYLFIIITTLFFILQYERIILKEEDFLLEKFKKKYIQFCDNTHVFIPKFKNYKKSTHVFSINKIFKQEYSSTASTIICFLYIDFLIQFYFNNQSIDTYIKPIFILLIVTLLFRILKKHI